VAEIDARPASRLFRALADETRLRIVALLAQGELCVCHIERALAMKQSTVSRQLSVLRAGGLVDSRRDGSWIYYRLVPLAQPELRAAIDGITRALVDQRALRADLARLKKACGPSACG